MQVAVRDLALVDRPQVDLLREGEADKQVTAEGHPVTRWRDRGTACVAVGWLRSGLNQNS